MPPSRKKSKKSQPPQQAAEPLEHVSRARERAGDRFRSKRKKNVNYDIEQNIREIRAILATNAEIFDRCMGSMDVELEKNWKDDPSVKFSRVSFDAVKTLLSENTSATRFVTFPNQSEMSINMKDLIDPPKVFGDIIAVKCMAEPFSMFIDYESVFENAILLHDDVLEPLLAKLKDQLMSVQVCLGKVDSWVMEPQQIISFLEETFKARLEIPDADEAAECGCPKGTHNDLDKCLHLDCGRCWSAHREGGSCPSIHNYYGRRFKCRGFLLLKEYSPGSVFGKHEISFDVTKENDQRKLKKFLEFLLMK